MRSSTKTSSRESAGVRGWLGRRPLRTKLTLVILAVTGTALGAGLSVISIITINRLEAAMGSRVVATAQLVGEYSIGPLSFEDTSGAESILRKLESDAEIQAVVLYDTTGQVFAEYRKGPHRSRGGCSSTPTVRFEPEFLTVSRSIEYRGSPVGAVCIEASTAQLSASVSSLVRWFAVGWMVLMALSLVLARALQRWISAPILRLAKATQQVALTSDYSALVEGGPDDEIGELVDRFNELLTELGLREAERNRVRRELALRLARETGLAAFARALLTCTGTEEQVISAALGGLVDAFHLDRIAVFETITLTGQGPCMKLSVCVAAPETPPLVLARPGGSELIALQPDLATWQSTLASGDSVVMQSDSGTENERDAFGPEAYRSLLLSPLFVGGRWHGQVAFMVTQGSEESPWTPDAQQLLQTSVTMLSSFLEKARNEQELLRSRNLRSLGVLAGGLAHDFNNLLAGILGNISLARCSGEPLDGSSVLLAEAEDAARRASDLTRQLLTFSRGGAPLKKPTSLAGLLRDTTEFVLRGTQVTARYSIPADLWTANVDENQVSQMVHNLVLNASQAMGQSGMIEVELSNCRLDAQSGIPLPPGNYVLVQVADHGCGIPADALPNIFDPYFTTKSSGTGLGLAVVFSIVQRHQGHIAVESVEGKGTRFRILLPASSELTPVQSTDRPVSISQSPVRKLRALVLDDEDTILALCTAMLRRMGFEVATVTRGEDLLTVYQQAMNENRCFDVVIMDLTIKGGMGGGESMPRLLALDPKVKAIVSSGYSNDGIMVHYRDRGFSGVLSKPYQFKEFKQAVLAVTGDGGQTSSSLSAKPKEGIP